MPASTSRVSLITREYRTKTTTDSAVLTKHPLAPKISLDSFLITSANANTLASSILGVKKEERQSWTVTLSGRFRFNLTIGATYTLTHPRFGLSSGKNFILRGVKWGSDSKLVEAIFFGPQ